MNDQLGLLSKTLKNRGFQVEVCENTNDACMLLDNILSQSDPIGSIGFGNSVTIRSLGLYESLTKFSKKHLYSCTGWNRGI